MKCILFKQAWVKSLRLRQATVQESKKLTYSWKNTNHSDRVGRGGGGKKVRMTQCHLQLLHGICVKAGQPLVTISMDRNNKKKKPSQWFPWCESTDRQGQKLSFAIPVASFLAEEQN